MVISSAVNKIECYPNQKGYYPMLKRTRKLLWIGGMFLLMLTVSSGLTFAQEPPQQPSPADFVAVIDNPYLPLIPGTTFVYEGRVEDGLEYTEFKVLSETRQVMGITATVMEESTYDPEGELEEHTFHWFAQDKAGNVWSLGKDVSNYEDGQLWDKEGSWEAGVNGARPGITMYADLAAHVGETYYQGYQAGEVEDQATLLSASENVTIAYGAYNNVVKTYEFTALDPDSQEEKFYAAGIGLIHTVDRKTLETSALIEFNPATISAPAATSTPAAPPVPAAIPTPKSCGTETGLGCAPDSARVDLAKPPFTNPTDITNPLFPISQLHSALLLGNSDGRLVRVETTLLTGTKTIELDGQPVETLVSQFVEYLDGRIHETTLDWYAQADDGSVWYFGEDVFNYEDGEIADREGTWLAGKDGPAAMIMPGNPQPGDVYRPENSPGIVFEEVTVKSIGETVDGPAGSVGGAIVVEELHMEGGYEDKTFAPGYGEFATGAGGDLENLALAVPTDALSGPPPVELETLFSGATDIFDAAESGDWDVASATLEEMTTAWATYQAGGDVPELLDAQMSRALTALAGDALVPAVNHRNASGARKAAIDVAQASLDLQLRYRSPAEIDLTRFDLWAQQILADAAGDEPDLVLGDVAVLEWIWDRVAHTFDSSAVNDIEAQLGELRTAADDEDLEAAAGAATQLRDLLATLKPTQ
jgi:hypothetical protein